MPSASDEDMSEYEGQSESSGGSGNGSLEESEIEEEEEKQERAEILGEVDEEANAEVVSIHGSGSNNEDEAQGSDRDIGSRSPDGEGDGPGAQILFEQLQSSGIVRQERDDETSEAVEQPSDSISTKRQKRKQPDEKENSDDQPLSKKKRGRPSQGKTPAVNKKNVRRSPVVKITLAANRPKRSQAAKIRKILGQEDHGSANLNTRNGAKTGEAFESQSESTNVRTGKKRNERDEHDKRNSVRGKDKEIDLTQTGTEDDHAGKDHVRNDPAEVNNTKDGEARDSEAEDEGKPEDPRPEYPDQDKGMFKRSIHCLGKAGTLQSAVLAGSRVGTDFWELFKKPKRKSSKPSKPEDVTILFKKINATTADYINQYDITNKTVNDHSKITIIPLGQWYSNEERLNDILDLAFQIEEEMNTNYESTMEAMEAMTFYVYGQICPSYIHLVNTLVHYYEVDETLSEDVLGLLHKHTLAVEKLLKATNENIDSFPKFFREIHRKGLPRKMETLRLAFKWEMGRLQSDKESAALHKAETERRIKLEIRKRREQAAREKWTAGDRGARILQANLVERSRVGSYNKQRSTAANLPRRPRDVSEWTEAEIKSLIEGLVITADDVDRGDRMEKLNVQYCPNRGYEETVKKAYGIATAVYKRHNAGEYGGLETVPKWAADLLQSRTYG